MSLCWLSRPTSWHQSVRNHNLSSRIKNKWKFWSKAQGQDVPYFQPFWFSNFQKSKYLKFFLNIGKTLMKINSRTPSFEEKRCLNKMSSKGNANPRRAVTEISEEKVPSIRTNHYWTHHRKGLPSAEKSPQPGSVLSISKFSTVFVILEEAISYVLVGKKGTNNCPFTVWAKHFYKWRPVIRTWKSLPYLCSTLPKWWDLTSKLLASIYLHNFPLEQNFPKPDTFGRLIKWVVEIIQFNIVLKTGHPSKDKALLTLRTMSNWLGSTKALLTML